METKLKENKSKQHMAQDICAKVSGHHYILQHCSILQPPSKSKISVFLFGLEINQKNLKLAHRKLTLPPRLVFEPDFDG